MAKRLAEVRQYLGTTARLQLRVADECASQIVAAADIIGQAFRANRKLLLCGNGGSAADCQHMAAEFVSALKRDRRRRALPAIALTTDSSVLTAFSNDFGFEGVFARQVEAIGQANDVLVAISTSGRSDNVLQAVARARQMSMTTIGILGEGGQLRTQVDVAIVIPATDTQHVQEAMLPVEHLLCEFAEKVVFGG